MSDIRQRSYEWTPSRPDLFVGAKDGLSAMRDALEGKMAAPPIMPTMGLRLATVEAGFVAFEGEAQEWSYNPLGTVHGGWIATILDSAVGCAVHTTLPAGRGYTSIDLQLRFVRPVMESSGLMRAEGRVIHGGSRVVVAEGKLIDAKGKLYATATSSCLVLEIPSSK